MTTFLAADAISAEQLTSASVVNISHAWSNEGIKPGGRIDLAVLMHIKPGWHINSPNALEPNVPLKVELVAGPLGLSASTPLFPEPKLLDFGQGNDKSKIEVFSEDVVIYVPMALAQFANPGETNVHLKVQFQACDSSTCLFPAEVTNEVPLIVFPADREIKSTNAKIFDAMRSYHRSLNINFFAWSFEFDPGKIWLLLGIAALGGLLLNFTPCVLPMMPLKIIGLSKAGAERSRSIALGLAMSMGVVAFWLGLAGAITTVTGFKAANQLFQYPSFTVSIGAIIIIMAIGMCGFFTLNPPAWIYRLNPSQETLPGSFGFGVMTAVLSTPCTAPFMGAAAAWATTQHPIITLATFASIGAGMALPYMLLASFPHLLRRVPRAGASTELIKQVMGLLLLAAGVYFLGTGLAGITAKAPDPPSVKYWWAVALCIVLAGAWLAWRTYRIVVRAVPRTAFILAGVVLIAFGIWLGLRFSQNSPVHWIYFTPSRLVKAQNDRKIVVLEFTAAWCLNCHALEQAVLHNPRVVELLNNPNVAPIKVDITGNNPEGNRELIASGRRTIPYLLIYSSDGRQLFASDAYSVNQLVTTLSTALGELKAGKP